MANVSNFDSHVLAKECIKILKQTGRNPAPYLKEKYLDDAKTHPTTRANVEGAMDILKKKGLLR